MLFIRKYPVSFCFQLLLKVICLCGIIHITNAKLNYQFVETKVLEFVENEYNLRHLSIISYDHDELEVKKMIYQFSSSRIVSNRGIRLSVHLYDHKSNTSDLYSDKKLHANVLALVSSSNTMHWQKYLEYMAKTEVRSSIILFVGILTQEKLETFKGMTDKLSKNSMFYIAYQPNTTSHEMMWYRMITIKGYTTSVMNQLHFNVNGGMDEIYDMKGLHIVSITLSWAPYFTLVDCIENKHCRSEGYLTDVMNNLGEMMNFTWESHGETNGNWGTTAISGPSNSSGVWGGVVGNVFNGTYQLSIR